MSIKDKVHGKFEYLANGKRVGCGVTGCHQGKLCKRKALVETSKKKEISSKGKAQVLKPEIKEDLIVRDTPKSILNKEWQEKLGANIGDLPGSGHGILDRDKINNNIKQINKEANDSTNISGTDQEKCLKSIQEVVNKTTPDARWRMRDDMFKYTLENDMGKAQSILFTVVPHLFNMKNDLKEARLLLERTVPLIRDEPIKRTVNLFLNHKMDKQSKLETRENEETETVPKKVSILKPKE